MSKEAQELVITDKTKLGLGDIQTAAKAAWSDIRVPGTDAHERARKAGIDVAALPADLSKVLSIKPAAAGVGTVDVLLIALGPVAWDLWKHVVLPHIREKWGDEAIKAKKAAAKTAAKAAAKKSAPK